MFNAQINEMLIQGVKDTLYMTLGSTALGYAIGLPMGITLAVTDKDGLKPNAFIYRIFDRIANVVRSIPFLILLIIMIPVTRAIVGKSYGASATIIPLVATAAPYIARLVESSLKEVDTGVIEAARAMGASNLNIIFRVLLVEARTSLIMGATIATGTILNCTPSVAVLGDIAVRYGYYRWQTDIMIVTVILIIILFQIIQNVGMITANKLNHKK